MAEVYCAICDDTVPKEKAVHLTCNHEFCKDCTTMHIIEKIKHNLVDDENMVCPAGGDCKQTID